MDIDMQIHQGPPKTAVITLSGFIETPQARKLRKVLDEVEQHGVNRVLFDISKVPFVSSTGLSLLVSYSNTKKAEWGEDPVIIIGPAPSVEKAMQVLGLASLFCIMPDLSSAMSKFGLVL
ncbi:MAG: STAS domain-containing protein [Planctomycetota bacterium]